MAMRSSFTGRMRCSHSARTRPCLVSKWYCVAELFRCPAAAPISRRETPAMPRSANRRSAVTRSRMRVASDTRTVLRQAYYRRQRESSGHGPPGPSGYPSRGGPMSNLFRLYLRVLGQLGPEARTGWLLAVGGLGLAVAQFAEPVLFGRIIDALVRAQTAGCEPSR